MQLFDSNNQPKNSLSVWFRIIFVNVLMGNMTTRMGVNSTTKSATDMDIRDNKSKV